MERIFELPSPAKINLFLDVIGKRRDGYHDIVTVFEKIDLCDTLRFAPLERKEDRAGEAIENSYNSLELPADESNLVYRACSLLKHDYGISKGVKIHIEKNIPIAAGLGGGSSNAATTLIGLNKLWDLKIKPEELAELGKKLGSDVPFFIFNSPFALGSGRGDEINPINSDLVMWHVLISLPFKILTKDIYNSMNLSLTRNRSDVKILVRAIEQKDFIGVKNCLFNALEPVAADKVTQIFSVKDIVKKLGFDSIMMTGSGPAIFVLAEERKEADELKLKLERIFARDKFMKQCKIVVARTATMSS